MRRFFAILLLLGCALTGVQGQSRPFVVGEVDVNSVYVGQPIIYSLKLFSDRPVDNTGITEPSFIGFGRSSIILEPTAYTENYEGVVYNVVEQRYILYPLRAGDITIDAFQVDFPETPFSAAWTVFTDEIIISAVAFPESAPDSFTNAVGQFEVSAEASPTTLQSGEALTLRLTVTGSGNLEQLTSPPLNLPENWRIFDEQVNYQQENLRFGSKTFEWTILIQGDGAASIPSIEFSFLNPQTNAYETRITAPIALMISPATPSPNATIERPPIETVSVAAPPLIDDGTIQILPTTLPIWVSGLWVIAPLFSILMWIGKLLSNRERPPQKKPRRRSNAFGRLRKSLSDIPSENTATDYQTITTGVYDYLGAKVGETVTSENIELIISRYSEQTQSALLACLDEAATGQYAPVTSDDAQMLKQRVLRACDAIEKAKS